MLETEFQKLKKLVGYIADPDDPTSFSHVPVELQTFVQNTQFKEKWVEPKFADVIPLPILRQLTLYVSDRRSPYCTVTGDLVRRMFMRFNPDDNGFDEYTSSVFAHEVFSAFLASADIYNKRTPSADNIVCCCAHWIFSCAPLMAVGSDFNVTRWLRGACPTIPEQHVWDRLARDRRVEPQEALT